MTVPEHLLKRSELVDYQHAVAGHAGTLSDPDGVLFIKPCTQSEIDFYEATRSGHSELAQLMPVYMGTLMLSDTADTQAVLPPMKAALSDLGLGSGDASTPVPATADPARETQTPEPPAAPDNDTWVPRGTQKIVTDRAIVMTNTTYGYRKPNILDIKLGQRLWADDAPRQKRVRMDEVRAQTTHDKLGFRIAGMRVYNGPAATSGSETQQQTAAADNKDAAAVGAVRRPSPSHCPDPGASMTVDAAGYRVYSKDFGRYTVDDGNVVDALRQFLFVDAAGVDADHARALAQAFKTRLERACAVLENERTRMFSASLLFVYEGDGPALRAAIEASNVAAEVAEAVAVADAVEAAEAAEAAAAAAEAAEAEEAIKAVAAAEAAEALAAVEAEAAETIETVVVTKAEPCPRQQIQEQLPQQQALEPPPKRLRCGSACDDKDACQPAEATTAPQESTAEKTEPDGAAAEGPEEIWARSCRSRREPLGKAVDRSSSRTDSGIALNEDDEVDCHGTDLDWAAYMGSEDEGVADDDEDDEDEAYILPPICDVRLIDFAHAKFVGPDEQPDENTLVGIRSLIRIFDELAQ